MSVLSSLDFNLNISKADKNYPVDLLREFFRYEWVCQENGKVFYLTDSSEDEFDWEYEVLDEAEILKILERKSILGEIVGVAMTWKDSYIGGQFIFRPDLSCSILLNINRVINDSTGMTDVNWYLEKVVSVFQSFGIVLEKVAFTEYR